MKKVCNWKADENRKKLKNKSEEQGKSIEIGSSPSEIGRVARSET